MLLNSGKHKATFLETWLIILRKLLYSYFESVSTFLVLECMIGFFFLEAHIYHPAFFFWLKLNMKTIWPSWSVLGDLDKVPISSLPG